MTTTSDMEEMNIPNLGVSTAERLCNSWQSFLLFATLYLAATVIDLATRLRRW